MEKYWTRTACPYDCPDACGLLVETDGKQIYQVKGDKTHPVTDGFTCEKMRGYGRTIHSKDRILYPMKRTGAKGSGSFGRISWEEAVEIISSTWKTLIKAYGAPSILPYSYAGVEHLIQNKCGEAFFNRLGASELDRTICSKAKTAGFTQMYGSTPGIFVNDIVHSDFIIVWGSNLKATWIHALRKVMEAKKNGSRVVLIETYRWSGSGLADSVILTKPGSDSALALAMAHVLNDKNLLDKDFLNKYVLGGDTYIQSLDKYTPSWAENVTGVKADVIIDLAINYGRAKSPLIIFGSGMSRHTNGAMTTRTIAALPALVGAQKNKGGGYLAHINSSAAFDKSMVCRPDLQKSKTPRINMNQLADALWGKASPIKSLYVYNSNPLDIAPDQKRLLEGFEREDLFTVVHERFMTDTARYADILLPADTSVEHGDIVTPYGSLCVQMTRPVITPPGECRSNWDTFCLLAHAMGFDEELWNLTNEQLKQRLADMPDPWRARWSDEEKDAFLAGRAVVLPLPDPLDFQTPSGKIELYDSQLEHPLPCFVPNTSLEKCRSGQAEGWLALVIAPASQTLNSTFTDREDLILRRGPMTLKMHPADAVKRDIADGDLIDVSNELACVKFQASVTDAVPSGTVVAEGVYRMDQSYNGLTVNALLSQTLTDAGAASTLCDNSVIVKKA